MYKHRIFFLLLLAMCMSISCAVKPGKQPAAVKLPLAETPGLSKEQPETGNAPLPDALDELAELERSGGFVPGLGLAESKLREEAGDYAGAVLAVYKELSWAYALGAGDVTKEAIRQGLENLIAKEAGFAPKAKEEITAAVMAILAFHEGRYGEAEKSLAALYGKDEEADSFSRFLLLSCALETGNAGKKEHSLYSAIRSRYGGFPEYWHRFARVESKIKKSAVLEPVNTAAAHAERCINLAPEGPYASECRIILAASMGLKNEDAPALKTRLEIEAALTSAANQKNPEILLQLLPLAALPDNPSTMYACGAMRALAGENLFRTWFVSEAEKARGRLAERLLYISRG